ncbi:MAG: cytochrome c [Bacteriovoracaceae bacterium]|nr:c-type cytochrome [Bacteroidota bacterium]
MDFLKQIALPQSEAQIGVLYFVLNVIYILLLPFISYLFGALILSLYHNRKGRKQNNALSIRFSKDVIDHILPNKSILLLFGVVPYMALTFAYAQLLQDTAAISVSILSWGLLLFAAAAAFASSYQSALKVGGVLESVSANTEEMESYRTQMSETRRTSGKYALIFLVAAGYCLIAGTSLAVHPNQWQTISSAVELLFSLDVLAKLIQFVLLSFTITCLGTLFFTFSWQGGSKHLTAEYTEYVKKATLPTGLITLLLQPLFVVLSVVLLPVQSLTGLVFLSAFLVIFFVFLASHSVYGMLKGFVAGYAAKAFYLFVLALGCMVVQGTASLSGATKNSSALLAYRYTIHHEELLAKLGINLAIFSGEDIFNAKCSACHEFGAKKVGPAYKDVLPKYENDRTKLLSFVMNPQKINPAFPPMPNQGLKPAEADSIAAYIMLMYKQAK